mmetsp:Transcript_30971/g.49817  ORF Transcript_30971/g.49817 Transcript_30971/m.49817 type:complete len:81 (+) Transcript_30971:372-614(+)
MSCAYLHAAVARRFAGRWHLELEHVHVLQCDIDQTALLTSSAFASHRDGVFCNRICAREMLTVVDDLHDDNNRTEAHDDE